MLRSRFKIDLIRKKSQKTKDKDEEYFKKIIKLGLYKLGESNGHREAIIKLMAPLSLSERKEIQREIDEFFLEDVMEDGNEYNPVWKKYRNCAGKNFHPEGTAWSLIMIGSIYQFTEGI